MKIANKHDIESCENLFKAVTKCSSEAGSSTDLAKSLQELKSGVVEAAIMDHYQLDLDKSSEPIKEVKGGRFNEGRWSKKEHQVFLESFEKYGKNWKKLQDCVGTRSSTQARSHAQKHMAKLNRAAARNGMSGRMNAAMCGCKQKDLTVGTKERWLT